MKNLLQQLISTTAICLILIVHLSAQIPSWIKAHGVIIVKNAPLRTAPAKNAKPLIVGPGGYTSLHKGANVDIIGEKAGYYEIYTDDGPSYIAKWMIKSFPVRHTGKIHRGPHEQDTARHTYKLPPAIDFPDKVPLFLTKDGWFKVKDSGGYIHFKGATVTQGQFSADIAIDGGIIKPTTKPVRVDFAVTVYDQDEGVIARGKVSIDDVNADGGSYVLTGPTVLQDSNDEKPYYCDIHLAGIWTTK